VTEVRTELAKGQILVHVDMAGDGKPSCPKCGTVGPKHDHRKRRWRHLPTCQYQTIIEVDVPRVHCPEHGALQVEVPWAERNSSFTVSVRSPAQTCSGGPAAVCWVG
jgi:transposase